MGEQQSIEKKNINDYVVSLQETSNDSLKHREFRS